MSILLVLLHHFHLAYRLGSSLLFSNGNYAVIVFFVISGYLITSTSLRRFGQLRKVSPLRFYAFRFARIYPCLILVLLVINVPGLLGAPYFASNKPVSWFIADLSVLTFWHNTLMAHLGWFNYGMNVLWSLSVEEVFYLLFPLLCVVLRKDWLIAAVWMAATLYAPVYRIRHATDEMQFLYANFSCFDAIAMGCCTALLVRGRAIGNNARNLLQVAAALSMLTVFFFAGIWANVLWGPTLMAAGTTLFLAAEGASPSAFGTSSEQIPLLRLSGSIAWFGRHSYELYLFHIVILAAMRNIVAAKALPLVYRWPWFAAYLALSVLVSGTIARWYSEPLNSQLRKLLTNPQRSSSAVAAVS